MNVPNVGATATPIAPDAVREVFTIMQGFELVATREAAARLGPGDAGELQGMLEITDGELRDGAYGRWSELNSRFHSAISALTGMPLLRDMTDRVLGQWDRIRRHDFEGVVVPRAETAQREHHELLAGMMARDHVALEGIVRLHNRGALDDYSAVIRRHEGTVA